MEYVRILTCLKVIRYTFSSIAVAQRDYQEDSMMVEEVIRRIVVTVLNRESKKTSLVAESLVPIPELLKYLKIRYGQINKKETNAFGGL